MFEYRTPNIDRKRKKRATNSGTNSPLENIFQTGAPGAPSEQNGKGLRKINDYFSKNNPPSPMRLMQSGISSGSKKSPIPMKDSPRVCPPSPQVQFASPAFVVQPHFCGDISNTQNQTLPSLAKCVQTDLTTQNINELVNHTKILKILKGLGPIIVIQFAGVVLCNNY
jgi:hypothetical protein